MFQILDMQHLRKIRLVSMLSVTPLPLEINQVASNLGISVATLFTTIEEINQESFHFQQDIEIVRYSKKYLLLKASHDFSLFHLKLNYLKTSIPYQILNSAFTMPNKTMSMIAEENHLSHSSFYRKTSKLKAALNLFDLEFDAYSRFPIKGSEKQIRFFYFHFYEYSFQLQEWPFQIHLKSYVQQIYSEVFTSPFTIKTNLTKEKIILLLLIHIVRVQEGYAVSDEDVHEMKVLLNQNSNFLTFKERLSSALMAEHSFLKVTFEENDFILLYILLICDKDFFYENDFSFIPLVTHERNLADKMSLFFLNELENSLNRPLLKSEFNNLYNSLVRIHLHAVFFIEKEPFFVNNYRYEYLNEKYKAFIQLFDSFYHQLYKEENKFHSLKTHANLYYPYLTTLIAHLDVRTFFPEIKIKFNIHLLEPMKVAYQNKIQSLTFSPITFINESESDEGVNLIISHVPLKNIEVKHFVLNLPATPWDWARLEEALNTFNQVEI